MKIQVGIFFEYLGKKFVPIDNSGLGEDPSDTLARVLSSSAEDDIIYYDAHACLPPVQCPDCGMRGQADRLSMQERADGAHCHDAGPNLIPVLRDGIFRDVLLATARVGTTIEDLRADSGWYDVPAALEWLCTRGLVFERGDTPGSWCLTELGECVMV
jgi:hypothetical protein